MSARCLASTLVVSALSWSLIGALCWACGMLWGAS